jgi:hypothetical protein
MKCDFREIGDVPDARGARRVQCFRCRLTLNPTASPLHNCNGLPDGCAAWPFWWEFGNWVEIGLACVGITQRRWIWVQKKLGLVEVLEAACGDCEARKKWLNSFGGRMHTAALSGKWYGKIIVKRFMKLAPTSREPSPSQD